MGSLIFFSAHQLALLVRHFKLRSSLSGYDQQQHGSRAARTIFLRHELDHVMPLLRIFNGSPLSIGSHPNTVICHLSATYFSDLISYPLLSKYLIWLQQDYLTLPKRKYNDAHDVSIFFLNFPSCL